jgi:hypothetical protein
MDGFVTNALGTTRLRRIASMSLAELGCRGRQQGSKWIERIRIASHPRDPQSELMRHAPVFAEGHSALQSLQNTFDDRFFAASGDAVDAHDPHYVAALVRQADTILTGHFDLLGYTGLSFGDPIDWHLDPVWKRRSPLTHWSQIDALDPSMVGDSKVVWELNRHQWMVTLAQATVLTGDEKYGDYAIDSMLEWIEANPEGRGINWASSLEVALRLISWTWVLALLRRTQLLAEPELTPILASIRAHADHVRRYLSNYYSPNTHLTGEALGLFYAGSLYPQFDDAHRWRDIGAATLIAEAGRQITSDGIYFEQSTCYERYTCDIYLHFLLIAERTGLDVPAQVRERLTRMVEFLAAVSGPDGRMPGIGDADGGWLMPLCRREADDCRGTLAVAADVLDRPDLAANTGDAPELLWLAGARHPISSGEPIRESRLFTEGGYAILRSGEHDMIVDVGPVGSYGHGHADLLSVQCRIFGEPCLVDPGTYGYTAEPAWREHFRSTAAHNTITIDHRNQAIPSGPFGWDTRPAVSIRDWRDADSMRTIIAEHNAYPGVIHRRSVVAVTDGPFLIVDELLGDAVHSFQLTFQFAPMEVTLSGLAAVAKTPGGRSLRLEPRSTTPLDVEIVSGGTSPIRGWVSPDYGRRTAAPAVIYSATAQLPVQIVTVLTPRA